MSETARYIDVFYGSPLAVLSDCLRAFIIPTAGHDFIAADFSSIEARVLAWLAGEQLVLDTFAKGEDIYKVAAAAIFNVPYDKVTKQMRSVGKTAILALGFGGGPSAFLVMAKGMGVDMTPAYEPLLARASPQELNACNNRYKRYVRKHCEAAKIRWKGDWDILELRDVMAIADEDPNVPTYQVIIASDLTKMFWRKANPNIVQHWHDLEKAAMDAVMNPGKVFEVKIPGDVPHRHVRYIKSGSFLWCRLPSGRRLCYPYPKIKQMVPPWAEDDSETKATLCYMGVDSKTHAWQEQKAYGGLFAENNTQAVARDFLVEAINRCETNNYPVIFHVHDEVVCEVPKDFGSVEELETLITAPTEWGFDCPIAAEGWRGNRYRKG